MRVYDATEQAYKNGYENGVVDFANYLKSESFLCDPDNGFSFDAIDIEDLDNFVKDFLNKKT